MSTSGLAVVLAVVLQSLARTTALNCLGNDIDVTTFPAGDLAVQYGNNLTILCIVAPPYNSSQVRFIRFMNNTTKYLDSSTSIVNETTAELFIDKPEKQKSRIECWLDPRRQSCHNQVIVDSAPGDVHYFYCRSYNLDKFVCYWRVPQQYIYTEYSLVYTFDNTRNMMYDCEQLNTNNDYNCTLKNYRPQEKTFNFTLTSSNRFGKNVLFKSIDNFESLIPGKPTDLKKSNLTAHSVVLTWKIPNDIAYFAKNITTMILYKIKTVDNNQKPWREANVSTIRKIKKDVYTYLFDNLPFAHWSYDVRVYIKSTPAPNKTEFWSQFAGKTFTTESERPSRPPATAIGAFISMKLDENSRDITIFWQQIDEFYESGENFTYTVHVFNGSWRTISSNKSNFLKFNDTSQHLNVSIFSSNNDGHSVEKSHIYIPANKDLLNKTMHFTKTMYSNSTYELRWQPPINTTFDSYTVFWCSDNPFPCSGKLNFTMLQSNVTSHRVVVPEDDKTYTFAIAVNRGHLSSGMVQATCDLPEKNARNKVHKFQRTSKIGPRSAQLEWDLGCSFKEGYVKGYKITYCTRESKCNSSQKVEIDQYNITIHEVGGLIPHTTYDFYIAVNYRDGLGYNSDSVEVTTLEDKPSEPLNVQIYNITAHTLTVSWDPPAVKNGILTVYNIISYADNDLSKPKNDSVTVLRGYEDMRVEKEVVGLKAFTNYTVKVSACTTICSDVVAGQVRTAIGAPGVVSNVTLLNDRLHWSPPAERGGNLDLYQVEILNGDNEQVQLMNVTALDVPDIPHCDDVSQGKIVYKVRAVNMDLERDHGVKAFLGNVSYPEEKEMWQGRMFEGPWNTDSITNTCSKTSSWTWSLPVGIVIFVFLVFISGKAWLCVRKMMTLEVRIPPKLIIVNEIDQNSTSKKAKNLSEKGQMQVSVGQEDKEILLPSHRHGALNGKESTDSSNSTDSIELSPVESHGERDSDTASFDSSREPFTAHALSLPVSQFQPTGTGYVTCCNNEASGLFREDDSSSSNCSDDTRLSEGYDAMPSNVLRGNPALFKKWKLTHETPDDCEMTESVPTAGGSDCVTHEFINKKLMGSRVTEQPATVQPVSEQPALTDPDISKDVYLRFAWNQDPDAPDNLKSLHSDTVR